MLVEIHRLLEQAGAQRLAVDVPVFELATPRFTFLPRGRRFRRLRTELIARALGLPGPTFLAIDQNPQEYDVGGVWTHACRGTWKVPDACAASALLAELLDPGDWQLYAASAAVDSAELPDAFALTPAELAAWAVSQGVPLFVQADLANDPWRVFAGEVRGAERAAA